jgi:hypothetical protein
MTETGWIHKTQRLTAVRQSAQSRHVGVIEPLGLFFFHPADNFDLNRYRLNLAQDFLSSLKPAETVKIDTVWQYTAVTQPSLTNR